MIQTQFTTIDGLRIRYASHFQNFKDNLLLLSPMPESLLAFNPIWDILSGKYNLLAIDLPGTGQSESREGLFSTKALADFVVKVIDHFNFKSPHILGPDIGTPTALFVAAKYPKKITSIIVSGGACVYPLLVTNTLKNIIEAPNLDAFKQIPVRNIINGSLSEFKQYAIPDEIRADYIASYEGGRLFKAMEILRAYKSDIHELDKLLDDIKIPVRIIFGEEDPSVSVQNAHILHQRLPLSELTILEGKGHYIWEDNWSEYLPLLLSWLNEGYLSGKKSV